MSDSKGSELSRRKFLRSFGTTAAAVAAASAVPAMASEEKQQKPQQAGPARYRETQYVRDYYQTL